VYLYILTEQYYIEPVFFPQFTKNFSHGSLCLFQFRTIHWTGLVQHKNDFLGPGCQFGSFWCEKVDEKTVVNLKTTGWIVIWLINFTWQSLFRNAPNPIHLFLNRTKPQTDRSMAHLPIFSFCIWSTVETLPLLPVLISIPFWERFVRKSVLLISLIFSPYSGIYENFSLKLIRESRYNIRGKLP